MLRIVVSALAMVPVVGGGAFGAEYGGGDGSAETPFEIWTAAQLNAIGLHPEDWDKHFRLMAAVDMSGYSCSKALIGRYEQAPHQEPSYQMFTGVFDGGNHVISNLSIAAERQYCFGMFGIIGVGGRVCNLVLADATVSGTGNPDGVGALAGLNLGTITNCHVSVNVTAEDAVGGLVGCNGYFGETVPSNPNATISRCSAMGYVTGMTDQSPCWIGGLVGSNRGIIERSYAACHVSGEDGIGGLVGANGGRPGPGGVVKDCYAGGSIAAWEGYAGGLVGHCGDVGTMGGEVVNCYVRGFVIGDVGHPAGGLAGTCFGGRIVGSFWDILHTGPLQAAGVSSSCTIEAYGLPTDEMKSLESYLFEGWDFVGEPGNGEADVWRMCLDGVGYPRLSWEYSRVGDFYCGDGVGMEDLVYLCGRWLCAGEEAGAADGDGDGVVGMGDFSVMGAGWE